MVYRWSFVEDRGYLYWYFVCTLDAKWQFFRIAGVGYTYFVVKSPLLLWTVGLVMPLV